MCVCVCVVHTYTRNAECGEPSLVPICTRLVRGPQKGKRKLELVEFVDNILELVKVRGQYIIYKICMYVCICMCVYI